MKMRKRPKGGKYDRKVVSLFLTSEDLEWIARQPQTMSETFRQAIALLRKRKDGEH